MAVDSSGRVTLVRSTRWLHPEDQAVEEMLAGWRNQQLCRNLQMATIDQRIRCVRKFLASVNEYPWRWSPALVEEYFGDLKSVRRVSHSTLRAHQSALRHFTGYITSSDYGWLELCQELFGTHPVQVFFDWNTATHAEEFEGRPTKRPFTRHELQRLFDHADDQVGKATAQGRKGWQPAFRDSVMLKTATPTACGSTSYATCRRWTLRPTRTHASSASSGSARSDTASPAKARHTSHAQF